MGKDLTAYGNKVPTFKQMLDCAERSLLEAVKTEAQQGGTGIHFETFEEGLLIYKESFQSESQSEPYTDIELELKAVFNGDKKCTIELFDHGAPANRNMWPLGVIEALYELRSVPSAIAYFDTGPEKRFKTGGGIERTLQSLFGALR